MENVSGDRLRGAYEMRVTVETLGISGVDWPRLVQMDLPGAPDLLAAMNRLKELHPSSAMLLENGSIAGWLVVFRNGREVIGSARQLAEGDRLLITLPPSGG